MQVGVGDLNAFFEDKSLIHNEEEGKRAVKLFNHIIEHPDEFEYRDFDFSRIRNSELPEEQKKHLTNLAARALYRSACPKQEREQLDAFLKHYFETHQDVVDFKLASEVIALIPQNQRTREVIENCIFLFTDTGGLEHDRIIDTIKNINKNEISGITLHLADYIKTTHPKTKISLLIQSISIIPKKEISKETVNTLLNIYENKSMLAKNSFNRLLNIIPSKYLSKYLITDLAILLNKDTMNAYRLLKAIEDRPKEEKARFIFQLALMTQNISGYLEVSETLDTLSDLSVEQIDNLLPNVLPFIKTNKDANTNISIIQAMKNRTQEEISQIIPQLKDVENNLAIGDILKTIFDIPKEDRSPEIISNIIALFKDSPKPYDRGKLLDVIKKIPKENLANVLSCAKPLTKGESNSYYCADIIEIVGKTPVEEREDVILKTISLLEGVEEGYRNVKVTILDSIYPLNREARENFITEHWIYIKDIADGYDRAKFISELIKIPKEEKKSVLSKATPLITSVTTGRSDILYAVRELAKENWEQLELNARPIIEGIQDGYEVAEILWTIARDLKEETKEILSLATPAIKEFSDGVVRANFLSVLKHIHKMERSKEVMDTLVDLSKSMPESGDFLKLMNTIKRGSQENLVEALIQGAPFIKQNPESGDFLLEILAAIPKKERSKELIDHIVRLSHAISNESAKIYVHDALITIPHDDRADVFLKTAPFIQEIAFGREQILKTVALLPKEERSKDAIHTIISLFKTIDYTFGRDALYSSIQRIPKEELRDTLSKAQPLFEKIEDTETRAWILPKLGEIPSSDREDVVAKTLSLIQDSTLGVKGILSALADIDSEDREEVISTAKPLFKYPLEKAIILQVIGKVPSEKREDVLSAAKPLIKDLNAWEEKAPIILALAPIPKKVRQDVLDKAAPFLTSLKKGEEIATILTLLASPEEEQRALFSKAEELLKDITHGTTDILNTVKETSDDDLQDILSKAHSFFKETDDGNIRATLLRVIEAVPLQERTKFIGNLTELFTIFPAKNFALLHTTLFSYKDIPLVIDLLKKEDLQQEYRIKNLMIKNEGLRTRCHEYLSKRLDELVQKPWKLRNLSTQILAVSNDLLLDENDPLYQKAIQMFILSDPEKLKDKKNPYVVFSTLMRELKEQELLPLPDDSIWKVEKFRTNAKTYRTSDLPKGINLTTLEAIIDRLEKRIDRLPEEKKAETIRYIHGVTGKPIQLIKASLVKESIIPNLMNVRKPESETINISQYQLFSIIEALAKADDAQKEGETLTEQEEMLLAFTSAFLTCPAGQKDGIALFYGGVKKTELQTLPEDEQLQKLVDENVQKYLSDVVSSLSFLREATKASTPEQASHQTLYLKNRLHKQVGLQHTLQFDQHTGVLYETLLDADLPSLFHLFFQHVKLEELIAKIKLELDKEITTPKGLTSETLLSFLKKRGEKKLLTPEYFEHDEDLIKIEGVTEAGIEALLKASGYLV